MLNDSGGSRGREGYHSVGGSIEGMNGYEELVRWRGREPGATCSTPLSRNSHNAPGFTSSSSLRPGRRPKGNPKLCRLVHTVCQWPWASNDRPCSFCHVWYNLLILRDTDLLVCIVKMLVLLDFTITQEYFGLNTKGENQLKINILSLFTCRFKSIWLSVFAYMMNVNIWLQI